MCQEKIQKNDHLRSVLGSSQLVDFGEMYCGTVDVTYPEAYNWYKSVIKVIKKN